MELGSAERRGHWVVRGGKPLDHEALLTLARRVEAAAADDDPSRMQQVAEEFADALDRHIQVEAHALGRAVPGQARILRKGQRRISTLASEILDDSRRGCLSSGPGCEARAQRLLALLALQARDERHACGHQLAS